MKKRVICVRTCIVREGSVLYGSKDGKRTITSPEEAAEFAASFFKGSDKEMIYVCTLNGHGEPVAMEMVAKGGVNYCHVDMAQIYKTSIISNAAGIICFHNHPSGSIEPSKEDRLLKQQEDIWTSHCGITSLLVGMEHFTASMKMKQNTAMNK